jgi:Flp pilus assembly protein TadG
MTRLRNLVRSQRGAVVIELALLAPILALMIVGIIDLSMAFGRKLAIEQAAQRAIEKVAQTTGELTAEDTIKKEAVCQINGTINVDDPDTPESEVNTCAAGRLTTADVTVTYSLTCDDVVTDYAVDCADGQSEVRYITAKVVDSYKPMFPIHGDGTYHFSATAGVRVK